ncbi:MAG: sigma-E processing peptidase SpoIIGA [Bacillota bacterium]
MAIYIEVIILDNFIIDYIILSVCGMVERMRCRWWRVSLASVLGVLTAFISLADIGEFAMIGLKILASVLMVFTAFGVSRFWKLLFDFYFFTFAIGGAAMGLLYLKEGAYFGVFEKITSVPTGVIFGVVFGGYILLKRGIHIYSGKTVKNQFTYCVQLENCGMSRLTSGFLDTGNLLLFGEDLRGVCICEYRKMASLFKGQKPRGQVMLETANGENFLSVYICDELKIYDNKNKNQLVLRAENVAVALSQVGIFDDFEILLSPRLF